MSAVDRQENLSALLAEALPYVEQVRQFGRALGYGNTRVDAIADSLCSRIADALSPRPLSSPVDSSS